MNDEIKIAKLNERERALLDERVGVLDARNSADLRLNIIDACLTEVRNARVIFDDIESARGQSATAPEKPPRELCAEQLDTRYPMALPMSEREVDASIQERWNARTIRAALTLLYERRKKAAAAKTAAAELSRPANQEDFREVEPVSLLEDSDAA